MLQGFTWLVHLPILETKSEDVMIAATSFMVNNLKCWRFDIECTLLYNDNLNMNDICSECDLVGVKGSDDYERN